jgi:hypothetical protein
MSYSGCQIGPSVSYRVRLPCALAHAWQIKDEDVMKPDGYSVFPWTGVEFAAFAGDKTGAHH